MDDELRVALPYKVDKADFATQNMTSENGTHKQ
jgi:hypothetical protein